MERGADRGLVVIQSPIAAGPAPTKLKKADLKTDYRKVNEHSGVLTSYFFSFPRLSLTCKTLQKRPQINGEGIMDNNTVNIPLLLKK